MSQDIETSLDSLRDRSQRLRQYIDSLNDGLVGVDASRLKDLARVAFDIAESSKDELRDNVVSAYGLAVRPETDGDVSGSFNQLYADKLVNDLRDALVGVEVAARNQGLPITSEEIFTPRAITIESTKVSAELKAIGNRINSIEGDIASLKIIGNQIGLVNISVEKIEIKVKLAKLAQSIRGLIDALTVVRLFDGIKKVADIASKQLGNVVQPLAELAVDHFKRLSLSAQLALASARDMLGKAQEEASLLPSPPRRIWTESEVRALLIAKRSVPAEAVPFVRQLEIRLQSSETLEEVGKLTELRELKIDATGAKDLDALGNLSELEHLNVRYIEAGTDLSFISMLTKLETLELGGSYTRGGAIRFGNVLKSSRLKSVQLYNLSCDTLPNFGQSSNLSTISITRTFCDNWDNLVTAQSAVEINLRSSNINDPKIISSLGSAQFINIVNTHPGLIPGLSGMRSLRKAYVNRKWISYIYEDDLGANVEIRGEFNGKIKLRKRPVTS